MDRDGERERKRERTLKRLGEGNMKVDGLFIARKRPKAHF